MVNETALAGFRAAVAALFKPGECPTTILAHRTDSQGHDVGDAVLYRLDEVEHPETLPPYWFLSTPGWYDPLMGNLDLPAYQNPRKHHQCISGRLTGNVDVGGHHYVEFDPPVEVFPKGESPFLVFESDELLFAKEQHPDGDAKTLQKQAMAHAFLQSGFPFTILVDSGSKSIHATVRLEDDLEKIKEWRASERFSRFMDLVAVVFGNYDHGVLEHSGRVKLVRTPCAFRENGKEQTLLAVGKRTSIHELTQWFINQLNAETWQEIQTRQPITAVTSTQRQHYLRLSKWRGDLIKEHTEHRGTAWWKVTNSLKLAGCCDPVLINQPSPAAPCGRWKAAWLWHVSAYVFNQCSKGWFFSQDSRDWEAPDRSRWDDVGTRKTELFDQLKFEKATDPAKNALVDQMMTALQNNPQMQAAALPLPPLSMQPPPFLQGPNTGAVLKEDPNAGKKKKKTTDPNGVEPPYAWVMEKLRKKIPKDYLIKLSEKHGSYWYLFDGRIWHDMTSDFARAFIARVLGIEEFPREVVAEAYATVERMIMINEPWVEYPNAIAFLNGTLYIDADGVEFVAGYDPADRLRSIVPCHYDPQAQCPRWESFIHWALPDMSRASLLQETFGYTLIPGQPFQSFFMMTGTGSNGKSVVLSVLQALHKDSFETVALANLGGRFSLGTLGRKRLAIDTEAENVVNAVSGEGNSATAILKSWTGGDPVKIEAKRIQGWSETINAKYIMSCNKKPRFVDPTKGVWRRLKLLKFEATIEERQADVQLGSKLGTQELPGIVNWAIQGLRRLYAQNGFTQSEVLKGDLSEYQIDSDSVALFVQDFMRETTGDAKTAWFDIRPFHKAYKDRCMESGNSPVSETEFRQRLEMLGVPIGRPADHEAVNGCPAGFERPPGPQHWSIKGWRCFHPGYTTQSLVGSYTGSRSISTTPSNMQGAR